MKRNLPVWEAEHELVDGTIIRFLTLEQTYTFRRNQSFVNPSTIPEAIPEPPVGYLTFSSVSEGEVDHE